MPRKFYRIHVANVLYDTAHEWQSCARSSQTRRRQPKLYLCSPAAPLRFVTIYILWRYAKTKTSNQFILIMTDRLLKLTKAIPMTNNTATIVATNFIQDWIAKFRILLRSLTEKGPQFMFKWFQAIGKDLRWDHLQLRYTTTRPAYKSNFLTPLSFQDFATTLQNSNKTGTVMLYPWLTHLTRRGIGQQNCPL